MLSLSLSLSSKEKYKLDFLFSYGVSSLLGTAPINPVSVSIKNVLERENHRKTTSTILQGTQILNFKCLVLGKGRSILTFDLDLDIKLVLFHVTTLIQVGINRTAKYYSKFIKHN
jgi:hypothetical protein